MAAKILIAPNSFKECADSVLVSEYLANELKGLKDSELILKPISDGGDGFLKVCEKNFNLEILEYQISTPFDLTKFICEVGYDREREIIFVESANVLGLKIIPAAKRNPLLLSSKGMGDLIAKLLADHKKGELKIKKIIIGVGGTGINDLGLGIFSKFGLKIFDRYGEELEIIPQNYINAKHLTWSKTTLPFQVETIIDVINPLLGAKGASRVFGKQKGLNKIGIEIMEKGFKNIINLLNNSKLFKSVDDLSGAGGGLAAGLQIFFDSRIIQSKKFILDDLCIKKLDSVGLVITGEGAFDKQSLMAKATGSLIEHFSKKNIHVIICCGIFDKKLKKQLPKTVEIIELNKYFHNENESIKNFRKGIKFASKEIKNKIKNENFIA